MSLTAPMRCTYPPKNVTSFLFRPDLLASSPPGLDDLAPRATASPTSEFPPLYHPLVCEDDQETRQERFN